MDNNCNNDGNNDEYTRLDNEGEDDVDYVKELVRKVSDLETALKVKNTMLDDQNDVISRYKQDIVTFEDEIRSRNIQMEALEDDIYGLKKIISDL